MSSDPIADQRARRLPSLDSHSSANESVKATPATNSFPRVDRTWPWRRCVSRAWRAVLFARARIAEKSAANSGAVARGTNCEVLAVEGCVAGVIRSLADGDGRGAGASAT